MARMARSPATGAAQSAQYSRPPPPARSRRRSPASRLEHGLTGWFTYFGAAGCVAAPLPVSLARRQSALSVRAAFWLASVQRILRIRFDRRGGMSSPTARSWTRITTCTIAGAPSALRMPTCRVSSRRPSPRSSRGPSGNSSIPIGPSSTRSRTATALGPGSPRAIRAHRLGVREPARAPFGHRYADRGDRGPWIP